MARLHHEKLNPVKPLQFSQVLQIIRGMTHQKKLGKYFDPHQAFFETGLLGIPMHSNLHVGSQNFLNDFMYLHCIYG